MLGRAMCTKSYLTSPPGHKVPIKRNTNISFHFHICPKCKFHVKLLFCGRVVNHATIFFLTWKSSVFTLIWIGQLIKHLLTGPAERMHSGKNGVHFITTQNNHLHTVPATRSFSSFHRQVDRQTVIIQTFSISRINRLKCIWNSSDGTITGKYRRLGNRRCFWSIGYVHLKDGDFCLAGLPARSIWNEWNWVLERDYRD